MKRNIAISCATISAGLLLAGAASAGNLVQNGGFESLTSGPGQLGFNTNATNWSVPDPTTGASYVFAFIPGAGVSGTTADTTGSIGQYGTVAIWGPGNGVPNGLTLSPNGGNFISSDPDFQNGPISQTVAGLKAGSKYVLTFDWAGAQQFLFRGDTTEGWQVSLGSETQTTGTLPNPSFLFTGWQTAKMTFTASGASEVLSFLAQGTGGGGEPPLALLDGVSLTAVPEPATWAIMLVGLGGLGAAIRSRRSRASLAA